MEQMQACQPSKDTQMPTLGGKVPRRAPGGTQSPPFASYCTYYCKYSRRTRCYQLCPSTEIKDQKAAMERELQVSLGPSCTAAKHRYTKTDTGWAM